MQTAMARPSAVAKPAQKKRSLAPKEHGAYAQLALPALAALAGGRPRGAAALLVIATAATFVAHEPALVVLGLRGGRARREEGARATRMLSVLGFVAAACGLGGLALGGSVVAAAALVPIALGGVVAWLVKSGREKSTFGELVAATAMAAAALPIAIASGWTMAHALSAWSTWIVAFSAATLGVRGVIAHRKGTATRTSRIAAVLAPAAIATIGAASGVLAWSTVVAALPIFVSALILALAPPHPRALARVGWTLVVASLVTTALIVHGARV